MAERSSGPLFASKFTVISGICTYPFNVLAKSATATRGRCSWIRIYLPLYICACLLNCWSLATSLPQIKHLRFIDEPHDVVAVKDMATLLHCSAHYPDNTPEIEWLKDGEYINFKGDNRRYRLSNGSLYFNQVHHSKGPDSDRGRYQCVATAGFGSIISRAAYLQIAHLSRSFKSEPQNFNPPLYLGDIAMFRCAIDGTPEPEIIWYRDGDKLEERFNEKGDKQLRYIYPDGVLEIVAMEFADFGTYKCEAKNIDRSRDSQEINVIQNPNIADYQGVPPHFVLKPVDTKGLKGENVHLYCGANGRDRKEERPTVTWLKDGTTIDTKTTQRFDVVGQGTLRITNVTEEDAGTYTCRASNLEDSIDADALLHILVEPRILSPPKDVYANVNMDVTFDCAVYGIPAPTVNWMKDGDKIVPTDYFQITDTQGLRILGLVQSDHGIYQCFVENALGTIQASAQLIITDQDLPVPKALSLTANPILPGEVTMNDADRPPPPKNLQAALISTGFVTLLWKQPDKSHLSGPVSKYSVYWKEKGSNRERVMNTTTIEANIQHLKPNTAYEFRVVSYNTVGASKEAARLTVQTEPEVFVPSPATNVRATTLSSNSIKVDWDPPQQENGNVIQYELIYYEVDANEEQDVTVDGYSKTLTGLNAFTEYSFRVVAHNQNGPGMSTEEFVARTYSDRPSAEPQNVTLEVSSTTSIIVRWEPPPREQQNGLITGYKIRFKMKGGESQIATPDKNRRAYALVNLDRSAEYLVRLTALTVNGSGPATDWLSAKTLQDDLDESRVPGPPTNLRLQAYSNSIIVRWDPPVDTSVAVKGYYLGYGKGIPDVYLQVLDARQLHHRIENLTPSVQYVISLNAFNEKGHGFKKLETATTSEEPMPEPATPMIPPVGLKATVLSAKTIVLTWTDSTLGKNQRITDARYYTIRYTSIPNKNSRYRYSNSTDCNIHIDDLKPNTQYEFSVKVIKGRRKSTWSLNVFNTTFESAPGSVARDLTPVPVEGNPMAVTLNWQPPQRPNGQITGYLVFYTTDSSQGDRDWVVEGVLGDDLSTTIKDLTPDTTYYFKVQARNSKGYGPMSPTVIYRTPKADGTGGGRVETPDSDEYFPPGNNPEAEEGKAGKDNSGEQKGLSNNVLIIIIACVVGVTFCVIIFVVTLVFCRRRTNNINRNQRNKGAYKSPGKGLVKDVKPPDLWIHHDHLELKNIEKPPGGEPSMTVTPIPRNSQEIKHHAEDHQHTNDMDKRRNSFVGVEPPSYEARNDDRYQHHPITVRPKPIMLPVGDSQHPPREPIATVTAMPNGHMMQMIDPRDQGIPMRPVYPRTQYNTQYSSTPRVHAGDVSQPSSIYGDDDTDYDPVASDPLLEERPPQYRSRIGYGPQSPDHTHYHHGDHSSTEQLHHTPNHPRSPSPSSATSGALSSTDQEEGGSLSRRMIKRNPLRSFKVPGPPCGVTSPRPKHIVKPQQPVNSPYKKPNPPISSTPIKPRIPITHRGPDVVMKTKAKDDGDRQKSLSTEELTAEMANLEGLMKDLNAITQQEFQC